jgi:hypothetical protein
MVGNSATNVVEEKNEWHSRDRKRRKFSQQTPVIISRQPAVLDIFFMAFHK